MKEYMEKDNYILCPICGKEKFNMDNHFIFCNHCGWEGNINVDERIEEVNGISIKDYKKVYEEYIKEHPDYCWKNDKDALDKYMDSFKDYGSLCPVCGEDSFEPDYRYCYKCGWKYNFVQAQYTDFKESTNKLSLDEYKDNYSKIIKNDPNYMWKNTENVNIPFNDNQLNWLNENKIRTDFNKLTSDEELNSIFDSIEKIQREYENSDEFEKYMFIKSILDTMLDNL